MFKNYFIVAIRNFLRHKIFSAINVIGLAIGISASLVIYLIVSYDFSFDKFEPGRNRIYRVVSDMKFPDNDFKNSGVPLPLVKVAPQIITGVDVFAPFSITRSMKVKVSAASPDAAHVYKKQHNIIYADGNYFRLIPYTWLAGSPATALDEPNKVVLTESRAKAYFANNDVTKDIGKIIVYDDTINATITGIVKDLKQETDFTFREFLSYSTMPASKFAAEAWGGVGSSDQFFVKLKDGASRAAVQQQIQKLFDGNQKHAYLKNIFWLQPFSNIHFNADYDNFDQQLANLPTLYSLLIVAAILLLLGCINFINLTTAQAVQRAKEIGIRKTIGGTKSQLVFQFLAETFLLTLCATIISIMLVPLILKLFSDFIPAGITVAMLGNAGVLLFIVVLIIMVSIFAGFYPAIILSGLKPVQVLKNHGTAGTSSRRLWVRKSLTVTQFVFAQSFIIAAIIVSQQIRFMLDDNPGFAKEGIITVRTPMTNADYQDKNILAATYSKRKTFLEQLNGLPGISRAAMGGSPPTSEGESMQTMKYNDGKKDIETTVEVKNGDENYLKLFGIQLLAGRYDQPSDTIKEYVINEAYSKFLGFKTPQDAIGKTLQGKQIVGVVKDFYMHSMRKAIKPMIFYSHLPLESSVHIALKPQTTPNAWSKTISQIEVIYKSTYPGEDFSYSFLDDAIAKLYTSEQQTSTLLTWATSLAIIISCLGLLGLVIYTINQRTKEIGVRKILGASVLQIVQLISKDFLKLVLLAFIIAIPVAWWGVRQWLDGFAYKINISVLIFIVAGLLAMLIALVTISFQAIKAAMANPVKGLRTE